MKTAALRVINPSTARAWSNWHRWVESSAEKKNGTGCISEDSRGDTTDAVLPGKVINTDVQPIIAVDDQISGVRRALEEMGYQVQNLSEG